MSEIILADESYRIIGACFEVYNTMGCGFLESVYHECLEFELSDQNIPFQSKRELSLHYKNRPLRKKFEADFICFDQVVVEIKACSDLTDDHSAQLLNYLRVSGNSERESTYVIAFRHLTTYDDRPILAVKHVIPLFPGTLRQSNSRTPSFI